MAFPGAQRRCRPAAPVVPRGHNVATPDDIRLGLRHNWRQFALLVLINAFVGGMVGMERAVVPLIGAREFGLTSTTFIVSFIASFGVVKACANLVSGRLADRWGRKRVLVLGWLVGIPVPFMIMWAPGWEWVVLANVLLGVNQGFAWSATVVMKIDLVGRRSRGLAVGLNEFAGYLAVGLTALLSGYLAARYGLRPASLYPGVAYAAIGTVLSIGLVRDTRLHVEHERTAEGETGAAPPFREVFARATYRDRNLFAASQAGLVNNLNDGMSWGLFPLFFASHGLGIERIGALKAIYPAAWGIFQVVTGPLSDRWGRKGLIVAGMWLQAAALIWIAQQTGFAAWAIASLLLGIGTAMVYPALIAAVSDAAAPSWRAGAVGVYRFWRDLGYAIGAVGAGLVADRWGFPAAIALTGIVTFLSGVVVFVLMRETRRSI